MTPWKTFDLFQLATFVVNKSLSVSCSIIWKGAKVFRNFFHSVDFVSIILQGGVIWVCWVLLGFGYELADLRWAKVGNESLAKSKQKWK